MSSDIIKLLPDSVANQIAAGEVIQRPASVVKELVENAVDAGATSIQIIIKDAGRTLIQVVDNGNGMTPTDARMAFERHATSKISSAEDLFSLHTMGFRGEALPSIAAVAQIDLRTLPKGETVGSRLRISESKFESQEPCSTTQGTNIMVKNLFFHIPARRKFLKKDSVELSHIMREFERLALVNPQCDFTIIHNDVTLHQFRAEPFKQRIDSLFGHTTAGQLLPVAAETSIVKIDGFIGSPASAKKRNAPQFLFVNGRNMRHPYFHKAIMTCFADIIPADSQPSYFINFTVDPETIDVNIHPQKHEIKFENEQSVWLILSAAVRQALGKANAAGAIDFEAADTIPNMPSFEPQKTGNVPGIETETNYNPFNENDVPTGFDFMRPKSASKPSGARGGMNRELSERSKDWEKLYQSFVSQSSPENEVSGTPNSIKPVDSREIQPKLFNEEENRTFLTIENRYIASLTPNGLIFIHRRRAHTRILYDNFMRQLANADLRSQGLIFPETVVLSPAQNAIMSEIQVALSRFGFDVSFLGDNTWAINATPAITEKVNPGECLLRIVNEFAEGGDFSAEALIQPIALALARSASVNHNSVLSTEETDALIAALFSCEEPSFTPNGLTILHRVDSNEIQHYFN